MGCKTQMRNFWKSNTLWFPILVPILASPLPILYPSPVSKCGFCVIVIAVYWVTEVIPLAVTSLLPIVLFPVFEVMTAKDVCKSFVKDTFMLFLGSLVIAVAVEKWNLHRRLALRTLTLVGPQPKWLLLGVMLPTWLLSMWMSNTATTAMMMPIVTAILKQIRECQEEDMLADEKRLMLDSRKGNSGGVEERMLRRNKQIEKNYSSFAKTFSLATAFSANIGGMATLTGTPPNILFKGIADEIFSKHNATNPVNFANWLVLGVPMSLVLMLFCWLWLQLLSQGVKCLMFWKKDRTVYDKIRNSLRLEYVKLGDMSFAEIMVTICFVSVAALWVTRKPGFVPGWGDLFTNGYVRDSTPAVFIAIVLFILPAKPPPWLPFCRSKDYSIEDEESLYVYEPLLDWQTVNSRLAWGVLLLMGGGFAMADGCEQSGLSGWMSSNLEGLSSLPHWANALLLSIIIALATEVTSNAATTTLFVPLVGDLAIKLGVNPLYFMIPCTIASSLAFLLPVATPPNAIVFASGFLKVKDMFLAGLPMNIFAILVLNVVINTYGLVLYDMTRLPTGFTSSYSFNATNSANITSNLVNGILNTTNV